MFSENEIATLVEIPEIRKVTLEAKQRFIEGEVSMLEITNHDFLSLIMMTPAIGVALANGSISLFEELALNKMARKMSKGGYFMKVDPVAHAMNYLIKNYMNWEQPFFEVIKQCMDHTFNKEQLLSMKSSDMVDPVQRFARDLMTVPYIFVRFLSTVILNDESDIVEQRSISKVEYEKILDIGEKLGLYDMPVFDSFCRTFEVK
ncbi:hypothetical protein [Fulvivirga sediminis]|uniref:Uncharacterized protein n=1 Tax=Fulvivirga sediminis TaxID=2803949 RepID=A0A937FB18_9BACT|nr:hypothetical protein [Fulvivirga sediminis]MBL3657298.1 hypothetical protein [Fulvivirga sediminis]